MHHSARAASLEAEKTPEAAEGELPAMEQLKEWFMPDWCYPDFEKPAEEHDAIELRIRGAFTDSLSTWDTVTVSLS